MRRVALLAVLCLGLAVLSGLVPTPLAAETCGYVIVRSQVNGCCGFSHTRVDRWKRIYCTVSGYHGGEEYAGYTCEGACGLP